MECAAELGAHTAVPLAREGLQSSRCAAARSTRHCRARRGTTSVLFPFDDEEPRTQRLQPGLQGAQGVEQELHRRGSFPGARGGRRYGYEDEEGDDVAGRRRDPQWRIIGDAKVLAAEPDEVSSSAHYVHPMMLLQSFSVARRSRSRLVPWR